MRLYPFMRFNPHYPDAEMVRFADLAEGQAFVWATCDDSHPKIRTKGRRYMTADRKQYVTGANTHCLVVREGGTVCTL